MHVCDVDPSHGEMKPEHIYHLDGTINKDLPMYYFCQEPGCDGYGGPVQKLKPVKKQVEQIGMFDETERSGETSAYLLACA